MRTLVICGALHCAICFRGLVHNGAKGQYLTFRHIDVYQISLKPLNVRDGYYRCRSTDKLSCARREGVWGRKGTASPILNLYIMNVGE
jgi:hypothetical protein